MALQNLLGDLALDASINEVNETISILKKILKLLESSGNVDAGNRQRIVIDAITGSLTLGTVTTVTGVTTVNTVSSVTNVAATSGFDHRQFIDQARTAYNTGIRSKLS